MTSAVEEMPLGLTRFAAAGGRGDPEPPQLKPIRWADKLGKAFPYDQPALPRRGSRGSPSSVREVPPTGYNSALNEFGGKGAFFGKTWRQSACVVLESGLSRRRPRVRVPSTPPIK